MTRELHLAGFLIASHVTHSHAAWRHPASETDYLGPGYYRRVAHRGEADGSVLSVPQAPGTFHDFVDSVVPELHRRGLFRTEYTGTTLRDHLGLGPASLTPVVRPATVAG